MTEPTFDPDRLDVHRLSIEYFAASLSFAKDHNDLHRHARDPWLRSDSDANAARGDVAQEASAESIAAVEYEDEYEDEDEYRDAEFEYEDRDAEFEHQVQTDTP